MFDEIFLSEQVVVVVINFASPHVRVARELLRSASFEAAELVAAFVNAIFCSLDGYQRPRGISSFTKGLKVAAEALRLDNTSRTWGTFRTTYQGSKKKTGFWNTPTPLYLVDLLGVGSTSKVYRALTEDGFDCAVKMYVRRHDDEGKKLEQKDFNEIAKTAVQREVKAYQKIYGDELSGYVWRQTLDGMHCVVHPYFKHPEKGDRIRLLNEIRKRLHECFAPHGRYFAEGDQVWRHIGLFNNKLYLFDLADLEAHPKGDRELAEQLVEKHIGRLRQRTCD